ncbi:Gfo/Idh/MocA family oxidoreductase [Gramella lutea]|uniref:Gfo/Idh/MocA family oxidoreductase n=1 Tax=Christiangramia lutea TaxID=1607951 RepID=A0A9X1V0K0_9FLAO|nr:Gfo/Idh/MocA family oxidoreductase [Christiangramia lutea]MCH4822077.1 Gfo/Idh/MocA family oxidoreductase [Christiangramia lutea]
MRCKIVLFLFASLTMISNINSQTKEDPLKLGVIGLTHTHVHWILGREDIGDVEIVGIVEPDQELAKRYSKKYGYSMDLVFNSMEEFLAETKPEAVAAFGTIYDHLEIVETFAPEGVHVMVEKPLAVNLDHAEKMQKLAEEHNIHLLTNYETTWYPTNHKAREIIKKGKIGELKKVIVRDGHRGPKKLGINKEFLDWLLDPKENGAGALMDFGCYGANLMTWLKHGQTPKAVTAFTQQLQKENNPKVDDEAIIILDYGDSNALIQASWNWPIGRKDMEIYGLDGVVYADNRNDLRLRIAEGYDGFNEKNFQLKEREYPFNDPFSLFRAVIRNEVNLEKYDLSSLENNMIVMRILGAALESSRTGKTVYLD